MHLQELKKILLSIDALSELDVCRDYIEGIPESTHLLPYDHVFLAYGSQTSSDVMKALPAAAAQLSVFLSIHMTDDILDNDRNGLYRKYGTGIVSNMAQIFLAAGFELLDYYARDCYYHLLIHALSKSITNTCVSQHKELFSEGDENAYWRVIAGKTPPLFFSALYSGCLIACGNERTAFETGKLGSPLGQMVQISDDLSDVFKDDITPDWNTKTNNLAILYAMTAGHSERESFLELLQMPDSPGALPQLQSILIRSGAVSYCLFHLLNLNMQAAQIIEEIDCPGKDILTRARTSLIKPTLEMIQQGNGISTNKELEAILQTLQGDLNG